MSKKINNISVFVGLKVTLRLLFVVLADTEVFQLSLIVAKLVDLALY